LSHAHRGHLFDQIYREKSIITPVFSQLIIQKSWWFDAQEETLVINVENSCSASFLETKKLREKKKGFFDEYKVQKTVTMLMLTLHFWSIECPCWIK